MYRPLPGHRLKIHGSVCQEPRSVGVASLSPAEGPRPCRTQRRRCCQVCWQITCQTDCLSFKPVVRVKGCCTTAIHRLRLYLGTGPAGSSHLRRGIDRRSISFLRHERRSSPSLGGPAQCARPSGLGRDMDLCGERSPDRPLKRGHLLTVRTVRLGRCHTLPRLQLTVAGTDCKTHKPETAQATATTLLGWTTESNEQRSREKSAQAMTQPKVCGTGRSAEVQFNRCFECLQQATLTNA